MNDTRPFPIQAEKYHLRAEGGGGISYIPWWLAEIVYQKYSKKFGTRQSLETLAKRGGFGREEMMRILFEDFNFEKDLCMCPMPSCPMHRKK